MVDPETKQARMLHLAITKGYPQVEKFLNSQRPPVLREQGIWDHGPHWHGAYQAIQLAGAVRTVEYSSLHGIKLRWRRLATQAVTRHQTSVVDILWWTEKATTSRLAYNREVAAAKRQMAQARRELAVAQFRRVHQIEMGYLLRHYMLEDTSDEMAV